MAEYTIKNYDTLVADMAAWVIAHAPQINDLTPGSVLRSIVEGVALGIEEVYVTGYLGFQRELASLPQNIFNFSKKTGTQATTQVIFSGPVAGVGGTTIAAGTRVKTPSGLIFTTDTVATISAGQTSSNSVGVTADQVGTAYNVSASEISVLGDSVIGVNSVTNANAATGGTDAESVYAWQQRFQTYIEGLGITNPAGALSAALEYAGITSASVVEYNPAQNNIDARIYVDNGTLSGVNAVTIEAIQAIIDGNRTAASPGARALGVNVVVAAPTIVTQNIIMTLWLTSDADITSVTTDINTAVTNYINTLGIGATLVKAKLESVIMGVYGVVDVQITLPTQNITVNQSQVVRVGTISITIGG